MGELRILGLPIKRITRKELLSKVKQVLQRGEKLQIATVNPEFLVDSQKDKGFFALLQHTFNVPDGVGVMWAGYFLQKTKSKGGLRRWFWFFISLALVPFWRVFFRVFPEKLSGSDIFWDLLALAQQEGFSVFLLGGEKGVAKKVAEKIKIRFPGLKIAGVLDGLKVKPKETPALAQKISSLRPQLLFVALGSPKQEKWIAENLKFFEGSLVAVGVGGTFDFVAQKIPRAPYLFRVLGLEWLWRLILEPRKRLKRIYKAVIVFPWLMSRTR